MASILAKLGASWRAAVHHPAEHKQSAAGRLIALHNTGQPRWTPRNYQALAKQGFSENAIGYRCIRMIAESAASVPWLLYGRDGEGKKCILDEHPLLDLLARPNPASDCASLLEAFYGTLQVSGNGYLEACILDNQVRELHVLRPDRMKVIPGPNGWPRGFEYGVNGRTVRFDQDGGQIVPPVLHMRLFNPLDDHYGMSPIEAAARGVDIHNASGSWTKALLDNSARPSGAVVYKGPEGEGNLSDDQFARIRAELENSYQGSQNAGRPMVLEGGLDWKQISHSPKDMEHIEAKHVAAREIALAFGVPPMLLAIPGDNTYANFAEASRTFWRQTVLPLVARTAAGLTHWLRPAFGNDLTLGFDRESIEALSTEREALWSRLGEADFLTINEKRSAAGYPPVTGGDQLAL